jgi:hypothetical protein
VTAPRASSLRLSFRRRPNWAPRPKGGSIGLLAPAGTPIGIIEQIAQATRTAIAEPAYQQMLIDAGIRPSRLKPRKIPAVSRRCCSLGAGRQTARGEDRPLAPQLVVRGKYSIVVAPRIACRSQLYATYLLPFAKPPAAALSLARRALRRWAIMCAIIQV